MSVLTTLVVPPVLRLLYAGDPETVISAEDRASQAGRLPDLGAGDAREEPASEAA